MKTIDTITNIIISFIALIIWLIFLIITLVAKVIKAILQGITLMFTQFYESIVWCITDDTKQYTFRKYILRKCKYVLHKLWHWLDDKEKVIYNRE